MIKYTVLYKPYIIFKFLVDRTIKKMRRLEMKNRPKRVVNKTKNKIVSSKTLHPRTLLPKINLQNKQKQGMLYQNCDFSERHHFI